MTSVEQAEAVARPRARTARRRRRLLQGNWWRYLVSLLAIGFALFPIVYVVSAAFDPIPSLTTASLVPDEVTLDNFRRRSCRSSWARWPRTRSRASASAGGGWG
jgi:arabinogalactan oligomer/maltooligosaccharide transport system permease protein